MAQDDMSRFLQTDHTNKTFDRGHANVQFSGNNQGGQPANQTQYL